jgi:hypothetical protein
MTTPTPSVGTPAGQDARTPQDYAIEHAGYLATAAEVFMARHWADPFGENQRALEAAIYEFRKRRDRAALTRTPSPSAQPVAWWQWRLREHGRDPTWRSGRELPVGLSVDGDADWEVRALYAHSAPSAQPDDAVRQAAFAEWLAREIPPGTVISDPAWWAPRIYRAALASSTVAPDGENS